MAEKLTDTLFADLNNPIIAPAYTNRGNNPARLVGDPDNIAGEGEKVNSVVNKLHLIKIANDLPFNDDDLIKRFPDMTKFTSYTALCMHEGAQAYDVDDFLYCKNIGYPINHMITLRRYPAATTDNIFDNDEQAEPDIARMVTYFDQETNKMDELLAMSWGMRWKELQSEMEEATMHGGDTQGFSGNMFNIMKYLDPTLQNNAVTGDPKMTLDPKYDQNKVYGPVDSITNTHIRDVGFDYTKEFEIQFDYELRSINGRTPEFVFRDIIANVLAVTFNNGKFWRGSRRSLKTFNG